jgi:transposase InsO family protein
VLGLHPRTVQRWRTQGGGEDRREGPCVAPANKLSAQEKAQVLTVANSPEFRDLSPKQIVPLLAERGQYVASESTFYRVLRAEGQQKHRERSRPASPRPKGYTATGPSQVWSWDITYLKAGVRGSFFYLYLFVDVWSRKIVGWEVHDEESMDYASELARRLARREGLLPGKLVLHSDNGGPMKGATMKATLEALGIIASYSRPSVSDDNPFSEALFRTLKYRPEYPNHPFTTIAEARAWVAAFVDWYNLEHRHSAINFVTPEQRHTGEEHRILLARRRVYQEARKRNPERWTGKSRSWEPVLEVKLNQKPHSVPASRQELGAAAK